MDTLGFVVTFNDGSGRRGAHFSDLRGAHQLALSYEKIPAFQTRLWKVDYQQGQVVELDVGSAEPDLIQTG